MSLFESAVELAFMSLPEPLPFALVAKADGEITHVTIVTDRSDRAMQTGRRAVREHADARAYAIVVDTYVRVDGERRDAFLVETAERGDVDATLVAICYPQRGEPLPLPSRPSALVRWDPFSTHWGSVTPDIYNEDAHHALHVVGHALSPANTARTARFLKARARYFELVMREGLQQTAVVDDRHQPVARAIREQLSRGLGGALGLRFASDGRGN